MKQLSLQQSRIRLHTIGHGGTATVTGTGTPNPSVARNKNRFSHWAFRVAVLLVVLFNGLMISKAADLSLKLDMSNSIPANEASYASLSKINMVFDFSDVDMGDYSLENCGIEATMSATRLISLYKGTPTDGELLTTIRKNVMKTGDDFKTGNSIELSFDKEYVLEPNQLYTLHIAKQTFRLTPVDAKVYWYLPETTISFYGKEASSSELVLTGQNPSVDNPISELNVLSLTFNSNVKLSSEPIATLKDGEETLSTGVLAIDENNQNVVLADFGSQTLYVSHKYTVEIPTGTIFSSDGQVSFRDLQINLEGGSFKYFSYGRIHPKNNSELSYLTDITVPVVCDDGLALGRAKAPKAYLYKGESTEAIGEYLCEMGDDGKSWMIPVWNFSLEPSTQYRVVLPKDQHKLWSLTDTGVWREVADTSNPELVLTYTTPAELEKPVKISLSGSTPTNMEACERIDNVVLNLARYEFEGNAYDIYLANKNPMAIFSDGTTETSIPVSFKNGSLSATVAVNRPLDSGKEYTLKIPANTFIPNVNENLAAVAGNDEILITVTGKAAPATEYVTVTYTIEGVSAMRHEVEKGKAVSFTLTPADELWTVGNVENATLDEGSGKYVTAPLEADHEVKASFALVNPVEFDFTTEVDEIEGELAHSIYSDGNNLVVNGVKGGDRIRVYTTAGALMADKTVPEGMDTASISLDHGVYIVAVNTHVYKARH